ncbi:histidine phosphatase family protein [Lederbergia citrea]|uniref:histidine phosphatase family protein n=1 Tax=Lederbergia citrea TaxID=2833581 RepID=UPI001BCA3279|nr:histidine phosphatase family protein [Lederbergia citrea]MBS4178727.1 histidine phosphatase family protein [Lederbergia citrea]
MVNEVFILRHGIRLDIDDKAYFRHYLKRKDDVPLSSRGIIQAEETGEFLKNQHVTHIFSSPFFRTLQTAQAVASKLNLPINVEYGFIEMLNPNWFPADPELLTKKEALSVFPNINPDYESFVQPEYPETDYEGVVLHRVKKALDEIILRYDGTILIVGHGASTESAAKALMLPGSLEGFDGKMCALNKYVRENGKWTFAYCTTDHLSAESILN